ncbi:DNA processing protein DprA [Prevotella denticola]|nr:DNA processing protein DprA [Prevotella denticola]
MILLQNSVDFQMDTWTAGFEISLQQLLSVLPGRRKEGTQYPLANDTKSADYDCS